jgi:hypothetical protein
VTAACDVATANGFDDTETDQDVVVHIPPLHGRYVGFPGFIEVQIDATRPSIFAGVIGRAAWPVGVFAVAANQQNLTFPFAMLALNETKCKAMLFSGGGVVVSDSNIHSNSTGSECGDPPISISRTGGATVDITVDDGVCRAVGDIQDQGSGPPLGCTPVENSFMLPDPLRNLQAPTQPGLAAAMVQVDTNIRPIPDYCPGAAKAPSAASPQLCRIGNGQDAGTAWILSPGLYPGGIEVTGQATAYLLPGIYWIGGGGFNTKNDASVISIDSAGTATPSPGNATWGGSVLIYNSKLPNKAAGPITLGGGGATVRLQKFSVPETDPLHVYNDIVIFQDRMVTETVTLNGASSETVVTGIIYVPEGLVMLNGANQALAEGEYSLTVDQIIADSYKINGNVGSIHVARETGVDAVITGVGLVD